MNDADTMLRLPTLEQFLYREADLLDAWQWRDWLAMLTDDFRYRMPLRVTRDRAVGDEFNHAMTHFDEDKTTIEMRIQRLETGHAWAEDPASRFRHFVSNVRPAGSVQDDSAHIKSNLLLYRSRGDVPEHDLLSAVREDRFRQVGAEWQLAERTVYLDHSLVTSHNLSMLL